MTQSLDMLTRLTESPLAITAEDAKRQHDYHLAQVHFWRKKLGYAPIITRSSQKRPFDVEQRKTSE